ncbi:MAG: SRPBCC family protein [Solirubrobacterales bacterium]
MITHRVEINRRPEDVFAYLDQLDRYVEWQESLISTRVETEGPTRVGSRGVDRRRAPGGPRDIAFEVTEHDPPRKLTFRGTAGPVRPLATLTVEPVGDGSSSRVNLELDLQGHGFGKLVAPFARRQAGREVPQDHERLKERLEASA